jgi:predicted HNH restriction endonuclease
MVKIASLIGRRINIELWFDDFATRDGRCLWVGFASHRKALTELVMGVPMETLTDNNLASDNRFSRLREELQSSLALRPISEKYSTGHNYYGIYDLVGSEDTAAIATSFVKDVLKSVRDFQVDDGAADYRSIENRLKVAWHLRRERDPKLARDRKERDGYRCQICRYTLDEIYGDIGRGFAEAHHIGWLSKLDGPIENSIDNLQTVCPNCHRMLHKMSGKPSDTQKLQQELRRRGMLATA